MKRLLTITVLAVALASCGSDDDSGEPPSPTTTTVQVVTDGYNVQVDGAQPFVVVVDGDELTCIWADGYRAGGPSCNWEAWNAARREVPDQGS